MIRRRAQAPTVVRRRPSNESHVFDDTFRGCCRLDLVFAFTAGNIGMGVWLRLFLRDYGLKEPADWGGFRHPYFVATVGMWMQTRSATRYRFACCELAVRASQNDALTRQSLPLRRRKDDSC